MQREKSQGITLEQKLRYLREIENIHRLSKKVLPPAGTTWARIADKHLQRALGMPIAEPRTQFDVKPGMHMHQHDPRTARVVERTLRNGLIHPDALHSFVHGRERLPEPDVQALPYDDLEDLPDFDLHVLDTTYNYEHPSHLDVRRGEYVSKMHQPAGHTSLVVGRMPQVGRGDGLAAHV